jgi:hypothetical protein
MGSSIWLFWSSYSSSCHFCTFEQSTNRIWLPVRPWPLAHHYCQWARQSRLRAWAVVATSAQWSILPVMIWSPMVTDLESLCQWHMINSQAIPCTPSQASMSFWTRNHYTKMQRAEFLDLVLQPQSLGHGQGQRENLNSHAQQWLTFYCQCHWVWPAPTVTVTRHDVKQVKFNGCSVWVIV